MRNFQDVAPPNPLCTPKRLHVACSCRPVKAADVASARIALPTRKRARGASMRSNNGPGIVSVTFAVQMKSTFERSIGTSK